MAQAMGPAVIELSEPRRGDTTRVIKTLIAISTVADRWGAFSLDPSLAPRQLHPIAVVLSLQIRNPQSRIP
ncbi:MAG TPA: hypothetical protein VEC99_09265 [Clostridia bacterium]|nr:hypothetical protein [Clostridia bacterium]